MAAQLKFYAGDWGAFDVDTNGSGLGFFGDSFGFSVNVAEFQDSTYITNAAGSVQGPRVHNIKWIHANSGRHDADPSVDYPISGIPNSKATLNPRFTYDSAVKTQLVRLRIYDRNSINSDPTGVQCYVAELVHPERIGNSLTTTSPWGSGTRWQQVYGSGSILTIKNQSPGPSGSVTMQPENTNTRHDWYFAISASPTSIGSKSFALYFSLEFL